MNTNYESEQISEIEKWQQKEPDVISKFADTILSPVTWAVSKVVPEKAIMGALEAGNAAGEFLARFQSIRGSAGISDYSEMLGMDLEECDKIAQREQNWAMGIAAVEGGITGAVGLPGLAVDIPAIIAFAMRSIHLMGLCYGFELKTEEDRDMVISILSASGATSLKEKVASMAALRSIQLTLARETFKAMAEKAAQNAFSQQAVILAARQLAKQLQINLTKRKMGQAIPFIGAGIGASVNAWYISDVCWAARRTFQERWLRQNGRWTDKGGQD